MNGISLLKCICDETRFEILELLQKNHELCVNDFVNELKKDQPLVSHHLKILKKCGIAHWILYTLLFFLHLWILQFHIFLIF